MRDIKKHWIYLWLIVLLCGGGIAQAATAHPFFDIAAWYRSAEQKDYNVLAPESILHSGDYYKIEVTLKSDGYLYIFQQDSSGKIYRLFPMEKMGQVIINNFNPVRKGVRYLIPGKEKAFMLDAQVGKETFYFLISPERDLELEAPYQEQDRKQELKMIDTLHRLAETTTGRPPAATLPSQEEEVTFAVLQQQKQQMCQGCVSVLPFFHQ